MLPRHAPSIAPKAESGARSGTESGGVGLVVCSLSALPRSVYSQRNLLRIDPKRPEEIRLECPKCGGLHTDACRQAVTREGFWSAPENAQWLGRENDTQRAETPPAAIAPPSATPARATIAAKAAVRIIPEPRRGWVNSW